MPEPSDEWKRLNFITTWAIFMIWQRRVSAELPTPWAYRSAAASCGQKRSTEQANGKGIKTRWGGWLPKRSISHQSKSGLRVIAEIFPAQPDLESAPHFVYLIVIIIWMMRIIFYRTPRHVKANAIGVRLKFAHSPEPLIWGARSGKRLERIGDSIMRWCWAGWKLFWPDAFN